MPKTERNASDALANHELARQIAILEERMNTKQLEYRMDIARLAENMAHRDTEIVKGMAGARWWQTAILSGVIAAVGGIVTAIILAAT